jgi:Tol biopolymer transport system component/serine/threonine protein kinase
LCARCLLATAFDAENGDPSVESFDDYKILCEIGRGGMGIVYLAERRHSVGREVALKALKPGVDTPEILRRFETERKALALMDHPGIATLYDAGASSLGRPYFVMEFIDGAPITAVCDGHLSNLRERLALFAEVCRAIDHAHRKGIVHRDIKSSNVLVIKRDGHLAPKVIDFGIARAATGYLTGNTAETAFGELLGTPDYMSPEQAGFDHRKIGPASDIYSLGVLLYEMLSGVLPFDPAELRAHGVPEALRIIREQEAPPPLARVDDGHIDEIARRRNMKPEALRRALRGDLSRILAVCLDKDAGRRYSSAAALGDDIDRYLRGEPVLATKPGAASRARKFLRKNRVAAGLVAALAVVAASAFWVSRSTVHSLLEVIPLTTYRGSETSPTFSPDASEVAFAWNGEREDNWDIYRLRIGESVPRRLTTAAAREYAPAWSPDGRSIAYLVSSVDKTADVMVMDANGGSARRIVTVTLNIEPRKRWLAWSRDGRSLLLAQHDAGAAHQRIFAISVATGEKRQLTDLGGLPSEADGQPSLSRDGKTLLFARDADTAGQLWALAINSDLSPAGAERRILIPGFEKKECGVPIAISARDFLFFAPQRSIEEVWRGDLSGKQPARELAELGDSPMSMDLSRDGHKLVYSRRTYDSNVWRLDLDQPAGKAIRTTRVLASTRWDENPSLSPDGSTLSFESNRGGYSEIWLASADGADVRPLTNLHTGTSSPLWSPDGRSIAFNALRNGRPNVFIVPAQGGEPRELTLESTEAIQPVWSPDGQWIYFCSLRSGAREIWRIPAQGGDPERITRHGGFDVAFSPDGRWIYFSRERAASTSIWRATATGADETLVIPSAIGGHVFASQRRLYFNQTTNGSNSCEIRVLDLATGKIKTIGTTDRLLRSRLAVSPDERSIYFTQIDEDGMDLMLVPDIAEELSQSSWFPLLR